MRSSLRDLAKRSPLGALVRFRRRLQTRHLPTPQAKHSLLRQYAGEHDLRILVETGTNEGDTVAACLDTFTEIHSIELADSFYELAVRRFAQQPHVHLHQGDSAVVLPSLLATVITEPALFWLDGHYCGGETGRAAKDPPIEAELEAILAHPVRGHVVLIDDARAFGPRPAYPTIAEVESLVLGRSPGARFSVATDIIRIVLP